MEKEGVYIKSVTRFCSLSEIRAWHIGESKHLQEIIGVGFENTLFISEDGKVDFYYDCSEIEKFEKALEQIGEGEFGEICTNFAMLINEIPNCETDEQKLELFSKMIPALTIFCEFDEYPEYMERDMQRRLMRIRTHTESKPYELLNSVGKNDPKEFVYFRGKVYPIEFKDKFLTKTF